MDAPASATYASIKDTFRTWNFRFVGNEFSELDPLQFSSPQFTWHECVDEYAIQVRYKSADYVKYVGHGLTHRQYFRNLKFIFSYLKFGGLQLLPQELQSH